MNKAYRAVEPLAFSHIEHCGAHCNPSVEYTMHVGQEMWCVVLTLLKTCSSARHFFEVEHQTFVS